VVGTSSTYRELYALIEAGPVLLKDTQMKRVRVNMDSFVAARYLTRGGGRKNYLTEMVRTWWTYCQAHGLKCSYKWIQRKQNSRADTLSKAFAVHYVLRPEFKKLATDMWGPMPAVDANLTDRAQLTRDSTPLCNPDFNNIACTLMSARAWRIKICLIHPVWPSQAWWPTIQKYKKGSLLLGTAPTCLQAPDAVHIPNWTMMASLLDFSSP
jgi:hypothetical protein